MLERFRDEASVHVPWTNGRYLAVKEGNLIDLNNGQSITFRTDGVGEILCRLVIEDVEYRFPAAVVIAVSFKNFRLPLNTWHYLKTHYIDGDTSNLHPGNLAWKNETRIPVSEHIPNEEFFSIPGFSRYGINGKGELWSLVNKRLLSPYIDAMGYLMYGVQPDVGRRTILGMHRLLALTFIPYAANVDSLDVNHVDGVKSNNDLSNLEWVDRKGNCNHAFSTGLRSDNVEIMTFDPRSKEEASFYSIEECARQLGLDGETVRLRLRSQGQKLFRPGLLFKRKDDPTPWKVFDDLEEELFVRGISAQVEVLEKNSGSRHVFDTILEASTYINCRRGTLSFRLRYDDNTKTYRTFEDDRFIIRRISTFIK